MTSMRKRFGHCMLGVLAVVSNSSALPASDFTPASLATIQTGLDQRVTADAFSGAVLIAQGGEVVFEHAFGAADREGNVTNDVKTRFRFGSMGKMFTATAIMQLVQAGKLHLQDPIGKIIPSYPNAEVAQVTIEQLLTHTGGTGDIFGPDFMEHRDQLKSLSDYVKLYGSRGVEFQPGSRHEYSNYGFILLGRVIEVVSGQNYEDYVREHVFKAAGMNSTDNQPESSHVEHLAVGYTRGGRMGARGPGPGMPGRQGPPPQSNEPLRRADDSLPYRGTSAGGGYSTVEDLQKFASALVANRLLNAELTTTMTTGKVDTPRRGLRYAFGFEDETTPRGTRRIGHGGGAPGMNGVLWIYPESGVVIVVLANMDPPAAQDVGRFIEAQLLMK